MKPARFFVCVIPLLCTLATTLEVEAGGPPRSVPQSATMGTRFGDDLLGMRSRPADRFKKILNGDSLKGSLNGDRSGLAGWEIEERAAPSRKGKLPDTGRFDEVENKKALSDAISKPPQEATHTVPLSDKYPFFHIRVHSSAKSDSTLLNLTRSLDEQLAQRFDVRDLKVVPLGMADNAGLSAAEEGRFKRDIVRDYRDDVGPLARLGSADYATEGEKVAALAPYRGKTVVLVGHVPQQLGDFFVFTAAGTRKVSISDWMKAARQAEVNLIPIGCNTDRLAQLGVKGVINSGRVLERLQRVLKDQPATIGGFFATLTSEELMLVLDPVDAKLFSNSAQIVVRLTNEQIGFVILQGIRSANDTWRPQSGSDPVSAEGADDR
jgi:hypothetical protein